MNVNAHRAAVNALPPCGRRPRAGVCGVAAGAAPRMRALPVRGRHGLRAPHRLPGRLLRALRRVAPLLARGRPPRATPRRPRPQGRWVTLPFLYLGPSRPIDAMEYHTPFPVFLGLPARSCMIATTAWYGRDHANSSGTTEKDAKHRDVFHREDGNWVALRRIVRKIAL